MASIFARLRAESLHEQGGKASDAGDEARALELYHQALQLDPERPNTLYNIGLIHKYRQDWAESRSYNQRAFDLRPGDEATRWNLAIAATGLGDWETARAVWKLCGFDLGEGVGPIESNFGGACVRLNPDGGAETVWVQRVDPVRARILNVPFHESGFFYGDIVLHDGAASGTKVSGENEYPVFNAFQRVERSGYGTAVVALAAPSEADVARLVEAGDADGLVIEDWTTVSYYCKACSDGVISDDHEHEPAWNPGRDVGVGLLDEALLGEILAEWASSGPGRSADLVGVTW